MFEIILPVIILIISLFFLVKSSDILISTSSLLGSRIGISKVIIGLTLVAIGTSLPELVSVVFGLTTSTNGGDFFTGTIIGSNIANSLLIFATLLYFTKLKLTSINPRDSWFLIIANILFIAIILTGQFTIVSGIILLLFFATYIYTTVFSVKKQDLKDEEHEFRDKTLHRRSISVLIFLFIISLAGLNIAARGVVYGIDNLAILLQVPQFLLTFTTIAFATSLPELIVTIRSAAHRETDIALGNIIGSNISNILLIGGVGSILIDVYNISISASVIPIIFLIFATVILLYISKFLKKKKYKLEGVVVFITYIIVITITLLLQ